MPPSGTVPATNCRPDNGRCRLVAILLLLGLSAMRLPAQERGRAWLSMDYGSFLTMSLEVGPGNIAQKGIAIRLDEGSGGVARGTAFTVFDTDTLRYAAAWSGPGFIDWRGIVFDGKHKVHPKIAGQQTFQNPDAPGWAAPTGRFAEGRILGRDGRPYGPLPREHARWRGLYRHGERVILVYDVGGVRILELPGLRQDGAERVFTRTLEVAPHEHELVLQVSHAEGGQPGTAPGDDLVVLDLPRAPAPSAQLDMTRDFSVSAWIRTSEPTGTILSKAAPRGEWVAKGKTFFVRGGRLGYDVGWIGAVQSRREVADDRWHHVAITHSGRDGRVRLFVDGVADGDTTLVSPDGDGHIVRLGYTATTFMPPFKGSLDEVRFYARTLTSEEIAAAARLAPPKRALIAHWSFDEQDGKKAVNGVGGGHDGTLRRVGRGEGRSGRALVFDGAGRVRIADSEKRESPQGTAPEGLKPVLAAAVVGSGKTRWAPVADGHLRLHLQPSAKPQQLEVLVWRGRKDKLQTFANIVRSAGKPADLADLMRGGPARWPETLETTVVRGAESGPFAIDHLTLPEENPWRSWMRVGGLDFFADGRRAALCTWQGDVWIVEGIGAELDTQGSGSEGSLRWRRVAAGMFQPLGLKIVDDTIYVLGRDQITRLHDIDGDGEADWYACFNNDMQVTEHFHEFAMDLQTDPEGAFYFMKGARHAKKAVVPHHGTLIRISKDGSHSEVLVRGFRAPNGLALGPDGSFLTTDQEGHWMPMNRINWMRRGGFYGNMMAWHERQGTEADPPLCWVHKNTDRSPSAPVWVKSPRWAPMDGALICLSYGTGRIFNVLHEKVGDLVQGGIVRLPLPELPTGIHRGRFHPGDGQLYICGLFGWSGNKTRPGGLYRIRRTEQPLDVPVGLHATVHGVAITFSRELDRAIATDPQRWLVERWNYKRSADYGSDDFRLSDGLSGHDRVVVTGAKLSPDGRSVLLQIPDMRTCMQMRIVCNIASADGQALACTIENTAHVLGSGKALVPCGFEGDLTPPPVPAAAVIPEGLVRGLSLSITSVNATEAVDVQQSRLLALRVPAGLSPSPFLGPGRFRATWEGFLEVDLTGEYTFYAEVTGRVKLWIDGAEVLSGASRREPSVAVSSMPVNLSAGLRHVRAELVRQDAKRAAALSITWSSARFAREPISPRLLRFNPVETEFAANAERRAGRALFARRGCTRCHGIDGHDLGAPSAMPELAFEAPSLAGAGARLEPAWVHAWLLDPRPLRRDRRMPHVFGPKRSDNRRDAADIAAWIETLQPSSPPDPSSPSVAPQTSGAALYEDLGCIACHTLKPAAETDTHARISLHYVGAKYRRGALTRFLRTPHRHHPASRMPDFHLTEEEALALASWLREGARGRLTGPAGLGGGDPQRGARAFQEHGCARCHQTDSGPLPGPDPKLNRITFGRSVDAGCMLSPGTPRGSTRAPFHAFTAEEHRALTAFIRTDGMSLERSSLHLAAQRSMGDLRCNTCHGQDGESSSRVGILATESRRDSLPESVPELTWAGEKLHAGWTERLLQGTLNERSRPWLRARMPAWPMHARILAHGLADQHAIPRVELVESPPTSALIMAGKKLAAQHGGLGCVQCHGVGTSPAIAVFDSRGVNFSRVRDRLRRPYFNRWMLSPLRIDSHTKMPEFAPDHKTTVVKKIFDGNAKRQFEALWHWLQSSPRAARNLVRPWKTTDLLPDLARLNTKRSLERGRALYGEFACNRCHLMSGDGGRIGPDLTKVRDRHNPADMLRELLEPSAKIAEGYATEVIFTNDSDVITGIIIAENEDAIQIVEDALRVDNPTVVAQSSIDERRKSKVSLMPSGLLDTLTRDEILDLLAWLLKSK